MKTKNLQKPLHSGFNKNSTASEVLRGISLWGKVVVITGGHSGIGLESTRAMAGAGAHVIVGARNVVAAGEALAGIKDVEILPLDLAHLDSVQRFASGIVAAHSHVHILMNNAGIMACPEQRIGPGRWESQFAINHLAHFVLVQLLWPVLTGGSRVIVTSSAGHHLSAIRWDDIQFLHGYDKWLAYGQSKTANVLFSVQLDHLGKAEGVRSFSLHPGKILTPLQRYLTQQEMVNEGWIDEQGNLSDPTFKTTAQGAATQVWAATAPMLADLGGLYCEDCNIAPIAGDGSFAGVSSHAIDPAQAGRLWNLSAAMTGFGKSV
ncbi:NAD(P)-dependent dehydrogenase, short-chain alcohol dehydrogenase family [Chitinophaga costaii]|uniref:NAD(P)-dependent dehydrogenase, short-chain alcohol dehydrogenase family n=1 Tax=Chitinophaga costaii TaxID=1335309 RepID=A0A1C4BBP1_9BACT|nr:SDR family NAD(P)-dependent oxidoreductase [Chitinophaga costaii]PUZ27678.1 oxidoreductase [Chitinophaga costaii]SCC04152.1 NAD(P)-dependent dehydrogenase, short-chain alcohol dehydrogenase family [Chitinophaga costaii]